MSVAAPVSVDYTTGSAVAKSLPNPPGYAVTTKEGGKAGGNVTKKQNVGNANELKLRRAWEMAFAPAKSLPMQAIMLYFSGSGVQIFSLGMIFMLLTGPFGAISNVLRAFEPLRTTNAKGELTYALIIPPMMLYVACQIGVFSLGLYKCWTMGILPTGRADWLQFETRPTPPEWSAVRGQALALFGK